MVVGLPLVANNQTDSDHYSAPLSRPLKLDSTEAKCSLANLAEAVSKNSDGKLGIETLLTEWTDLLSDAELIRKHDIVL